MQPVLILGGYGNFGKRIAKALTGDGIGVVLAGRNPRKAEELQKVLPDGLADIAIFDAFDGLAEQLERLRPVVIINTCGPFQSSDYSIALCCIRHGVHYIDLADAREFVTGIKTLDAAANKRGVSVISGASTVPGLSSAVLEHYRPEFSQIDEMRYGISPGQKAERGLATTQGILSYVGKALKPFASGGRTVFGWQGVYRQEYPVLGKRWMANCDIPDLDLFPPKYAIGLIRFSAGLELSFMHLGLWTLSWMVRIGLPLNLSRSAGMLLKISNCFDGMGSADGGMHMILKGVDLQGNPLERRWFIIAKDGDGPQIPTIPAIILAKDLVEGRDIATGAQPCVGLVTLERYLQALSGFAVQSFAKKAS